MLKINFITVGTLSEDHWKDAAKEYTKRLAASAKITEINIKEEKLPKEPSDSEIFSALEKEADEILRKIPPRSYTFALCIEGKQLSSTQFADLINSTVSGGTGEINFIIGSSYGLSKRVKERADNRFSMSDLTFPHQLARVMLYEAVYRAMQIIKGTKYHK